MSVLLEGDAGRLQASNPNWTYRGNVGKLALQLNRIEDWVGLHGQGSFMFPLSSSDNWIGVYGASVDLSVALARSRAVHFYAGASYLHPYLDHGAMVFDPAAYPRLGLDVRLFRGVVLLGRIGTRERSGEMTANLGHNLPILRVAAIRIDTPPGNSGTVLTQYEVGLVFPLIPNLFPGKSAAEMHGTGYPTPGVDYSE